MQVLQTFVDTGGDHLPLTVIAYRTGIPISTVHRLCTQLVDEGVLERTPDGEYAIGLRMWELGHRNQRAEQLRAVAAPFLHDLYEVSHHTVQLSMLDGSSMLVVERIWGLGSAASLGRVGTRLPADESSAGIVMLACAGDAEQRLLERGGQVAEATLETLRQAGVRVRQQGWLQLADRSAEGGVSLSAPVRDRSGTTSSAVSLIAGSSEALKAHLPAIVVTARRIGQALASAPSRD